jgi:3-mercaptopyruvate sulfurtransferase SseA
MGVLVRAVVLCFVGSVLGIAGNALSPHPARLDTPVEAAAESAGAACADPRASVARISVEEAKPLCIACTAAFVDARSAKEYAAGHVSGAVHLAPGQPAAPLLPKLSAAPTVIVYDRDRECAAADQVAVLLKSNGVHDVRVLTGAWPEWLAEGGPGESGTCALCSAGGQ